jgi:hypothetical protein
VYGPLYSFEMTKETERKIFIAKLTSNSYENDSNLAVIVANSVVKRIN